MTDDEIEFKEKTHALAMQLRECANNFLKKEFDKIFSEIGGAKKAQEIEVNDEDWKLVCRAYASILNACADVSAVCYSSFIPTYMRAFNIPFKEMMKETLELHNNVFVKILKKNLNILEEEED